MTKENVLRLYTYYCDVAENGNPNYPSNIQGIIKARAKKNKEDIEKNRPYVLNKPVEEKKTKKTSKEK